jgi:hypothetical protein
LHLGKVGDEMVNNQGNKIPEWVQMHPYTMLLLLFIFFVGMCLISHRRISRKINGGNLLKHPLGRMLLYFYILTALAIVFLLVNYFTAK